MNTFLTAKELAELIGCKSNSKSCMCKWLTKNGWPFERNRVGFPQVARSYYDLRMSGQTPMQAPAAKGPNRTALLQRITKNDRPQKVA